MIGACFLSAVVGAAIGVSTVCFCMVAGKADDAMELVNAVSKENKKLELNQFKKATEPDTAWLMENGNPHQRIIIEMGGVELVSGETAYPTEIPD